MKTLYQAGDSIEVTPANLPKAVKVILGVMIIFAIAGGFIFLMFYLITSSEVYTQAEEIARTSPIVEDYVGTPVKVGMLGSANISSSGDSGVARIELPVHGPDGKGRLLFTASKINGTWTFNSISLYDRYGRLLETNDFEENENNAY